jgi:hypothetical protein
MPKLPDAQNCNVHDRKITHYLLIDRPIDDKSRFFRGFGFTMQNWQVLAAALRQHGMQYDVVSTRPTPNGTNYELRCNLQTPDRRNPCIRIVWEVIGSASPNFVTAYAYP